MSVTNETKAAFINNINVYSRRALLTVDLVPHLEDMFNTMSNDPRIHDIATQGAMFCIAALHFEGMAKTQDMAFKAANLYYSIKRDGNNLVSESMAMTPDPSNKYVIEFVQQMLIASNRDTEYNKEAFLVNVRVYARRGKVSLPTPFNLMNDSEVAERYWGNIHPKRDAMYSVAVETFKGNKSVTRKKQMAIVAAVAYMQLNNKANDIGNVIYEVCDNADFDTLSEKEFVTIADFVNLQITTRVKEKAKPSVVNVVTGKIIH